MHRFGNILGNTPVLDKLDALLLEKKLEGVYLFSGPRSIGKNTVARSCARFHICRGTVDSSCSCSSCVSAEGANRDLLTVSPNRNGNILLGSLENLENLLGRETSSYPRKAVVIDDCDLLTGQLADRLLKSLESVGPGDLVILVSSDASRVSPTIRSRALEIRFRDLSVADYMLVCKRAGYSGDSLEDLVRSRRSLSLGILGNITRYSMAREKAPRLLSYMHKVQPAKVSGMIRSLPEDKDSLALIEILSQTLSDLLTRRMLASSCTGLLHSGAKSAEKLEEWSESDIILCHDIISPLLHPGNLRVLDGFSFRAEAALQKLLLLLDRRKSDGAS